MLLENTLIKKHLPRYNIKLKDSSNYAYIHLTDEAFPRICISRKATGDGTFFGPLSLPVREHSSSISFARPSGFGPAGASQKEHASVTI